MISGISLAAMLTAAAPMVPAAAAASVPEAGAMDFLALVEQGMEQTVEPGIETAPEKRPATPVFVFAMPEEAAPETAPPRREEEKKDDGDGHVMLTMPAPAEAEAPEKRPVTPVFAFAVPQEAAAETEPPQREAEQKDDAPVMLAMPVPAAPEAPEKRPATPVFGFAVPQEAAAETVPPQCEEEEEKDDAPVMLAMPAPAAPPEPLPLTIAPLRETPEAAAPVRVEAAVEGRGDEPARGPAAARGGRPTPAPEAEITRPELTFAARIQAPREAPEPQPLVEVPKPAAAAEVAREPKVETVKAEPAAAPAPAQAPKPKPAAADRDEPRSAPPRPAPQQHHAPAPPQAPQAPPPAPRVEPRIITRPVEAVQKPEAPRPAPAAREITVDISAPRESPVQLRVVERAGEVRVAVRAADPELAQSLRENLGDLNRALEDRGLRSETWHPAVTHAASSADAPQEGPSGGNAQADPREAWSGQSGAGHHGHGRRRQPQQPAWVEELERQPGGEPTSPFRSFMQ